MFVHGKTEPQIAQKEENFGGNGDLSVIFSKGKK